MCMWVFNANTRILKIDLHNWTKSKLCRELIKKSVNAFALLTQLTQISRKGTIRYFLDIPNPPVRHSSLQVASPWHWCTQSWTIIRREIGILFRCPMFTQYCRLSCYFFVDLTYRRHSLDLWNTELEYFLLPWLFGLNPISLQVHIFVFISSSHKSQQHWRIQQQSGQWKSFRIFLNPSLWLAKHVAPVIRPFPGPVGKRESFDHPIHPALECSGC